MSYPSFNKKSRIYIKIVSVCLVLVSFAQDMLYAYPDTFSSASTLSVQTKFKPIGNDEIETRGFVEFSVRYVLDALGGYIFVYSGAAPGYSRQYHRHGFQE